VAIFGFLGESGVKELGRDASLPQLRGNRFTSASCQTIDHPRMAAVVSSDEIDDIVQYILFVLDYIFQVGSVE
jgi:hypothetical protein